jgi:hypothetical protein
MVVKGGKAAGNILPVTALRVSVREHSPGAGP